ncbi:DUF6442 family protein [Anaerocolumna sp. MB42-C2]|uniref:DUF6442 family protein n=1 Tax=Anaerocolumna sp. MB42-C2 TaxID=3070997 RepID=UPI0027DF0712|nr:DUF6442 family protein [Anaerocolumna sp. MB42-C2]WMJ88098.1 DUF6442 family protein [Anaerocolumna sp. MB42-C2]
MNKDEILSKSRKENRDKDLFEREVLVISGNVGGIVATLLATIFFVMQRLVGDEFDYGLYAVIVSVSAGGFILKAIRMKRKRDIVLALIYTLATFVLSFVHIYGLLRTYSFA